MSTWTLLVPAMGATVTDAYDVKIETDERGFELVLHLEDDVTSSDGHLRININQVAEALYDAAKKQIGPWLAEHDIAKAEYDRAGYGDGLFDDLDEGPWPGESVQAYYERTGQDGPLREVADALNKARRENAL